MMKLANILANMILICCVFIESFSDHEEVEVSETPCLHVKKTFEYANSDKKFVVGMDTKINVDLSNICQHKISDVKLVEIGIPPFFQVGNKSGEFFKSHELAPGETMKMSFTVTPQQAVKYNDNPIQFQWTDNTKKTHTAHSNFIPAVTILPKDTLMKTSRSFYHVIGSLVIQAVPSLYCLCRMRLSS